MSIVQRISLSGKAAVFVCVSVLAGAFFGAYPAAAHTSPEGTPESEAHSDDMPTAEDLDRMDEASMIEFMEHLREHFIVMFREDGLPAGFSVRHEDWRRYEDNFYLIRIRGLAEKSISLHEKYDSAQSASLPALDSIIDKAGESGDAACEEGEGGNYFCAVVLSGGDEIIMVSGFDHDFEDLSFSNLSCPYITPGSGADKDKVAADQVTNEDTPENRERLRKYVVGMEEYMLEQYRKAFTAALERNIDPVRAGGEAFSAVTRLRPCWRIWPWKHGSIYVFIMLETQEGQTVIFNGNNPEFEGPNLRVKDEDGENIGKLISDAISGPDGEGFIEYKWDDPQNPDDDVDAGVPDEEGFRKAPGTSPKVTYVKGIDDFPGFMIASGFYPRAESGDGDGCAVSGKSSTPSGAAFNLFLVVSVLLAGVWFFNGGKIREQLLRR